MDNLLLRERLISEIPFTNLDQFEQVALTLFKYQAQHNLIYKEYLRLLNINVLNVSKIKDIPFLPIELFKKYEIKSATWESEKIFSSSGTTGQITSKHHIHSLNWYLQNTKKGFEQFYGKVEDYCFLCLLPSYLERQGSSLIAMADFFIDLSKFDESGFFLYDLEALIDRLKWAQNNQVPTILLGVSFALLDLAEKHELDLSNIIIMDTGGMKGRRKEMIRAELHQFLCSRFKVPSIHSEYGMTELLSQAYSKGHGLLKPMNTLQFFISEMTDPFNFLGSNRNGIINLIDLANIDSCAFIQTQDIGRINEQGFLEVLGRSDNSDLRGCNLMVY